jgi:hypothetical protein
MTAPDHGPSPAQVARMRAKIADGIAARRRRTRARRTVALGVGSLVAVSLVTGGMVLANLPPAASFSCYPADDVNAQPQNVSYPLDLDTRSAVSEQVEAAFEMCTLIRPQFGMPEPESPVACRLPDLWIGVFPNERGRSQEELCAELGLLEPEDYVPGYWNPIG